MGITKEKAWRAVLLTSIFLFIILVLSLGDMSSLNFEFPLLKFNESPASGAGDETPKPLSFGLPERVILLGIDSGDWRVIDPLIAAGRLSNFKRLADQGARGVLRSIRPMLSPPIWTTIATGKDREKHGIGDVQQTDRKTRKQFFRAFSFNRKSPALWNILSSRGLSSCVVNWWSTWPAEDIDGCVVSNHFVLSFLSRKEIEEKLTHPATLFDEIKGMAVDPGDEAEKKKMAGLFGGQRGVEKHYRNDETVARITEYLLEKYKPAFCAAYFWELDHLKHIRWLKDMDKPDRLIKSYYGYMDQILGRFIDRMDRQTVLVVVSDHGFARARHREEGIILLYGAGIRPGSTFENATVRDVAPTILALLGQPAGKDMDGRVLTAGFTPALLKQRPVRFIDTYDDIYRPAEPVDDLSATKNLHDKLRSMGYIE